MDTKQTEALRLRDLAHTICNNQSLPLDVRQLAFVLAAGLGPQHARIAELEVLAERLKQEAQGHAQEARAANATIAEIYQCVSGATGEPGNWNGAEPVRRHIAELEAQHLQELRAYRTTVDNLEAQFAAIGAGGVSKLMGASQAQPVGAAPVAWMDDLAELSMLNSLIDLGAMAAGFHATSNSDDGHAGTAAQVQWRETRAQMGELIRAAYATAPQPAAQALDAEIAAYAVGDAKIERMSQACGGFKWAVRMRGDVLNKQGYLEYEPNPSGRDDAFIARCRFDSAQEAIDAAIAAKQGGAS